MKIHDELDENEIIAFNEWLDQREQELLIDDNYWQEAVYNKQERLAREKFFTNNPNEKYDSPEFTFNINEI